MATQLTGISVYVGDIHGSRLIHLEEALSRLDIGPSALLCSMDLDQVLSVQDLVDLERRYLSAGRSTALVPGNHEAAVIHQIGIDSSTYRDIYQDTTIMALIEAINLPHFSNLREFLADKLQTTGGIEVSLGAGGSFPALLIHAALAGKQEKYLNEFTPELQELVRSRPDLWARLESGEHLKANFKAMKKRGVQSMVRGHDHYAALRTTDENDQLLSHQVVINLISDQGLDYETAKPRPGDNADDMTFADPHQLTEARDSGALYWHELDAGSCHVLNFGHYYMGHFGLILHPENYANPKIAFCKTEVSFYTAMDRRKRLKPFTLAQQARSGKSFYDLFPRKGRGS